MGLRYEAAAVRQCILQGLLESEHVTHNDSLLFAQIEDDIRKLLGVKYPADDWSHFYIIEKCILLHIYICKQKFFQYFHMFLINKISIFFKEYASEIFEVIFY